MKSDAKAWVVRGMGVEAALKRTPDSAAHFGDGERSFRSIVNGRFGDRERSGATLVSLWL